MPFTNPDHLSLSIIQQRPLPAVQHSMTLGNLFSEKDSSQSIPNWDRAGGDWERMKERSTIPASVKRRRTAAEVLTDMEKVQTFPEATAKLATDSVRVEDIVEE